MEKTFFSIITPVFNGKNFIDDYIISLKSQLYKNWEAIIIDDNSSDDSYKYLKYLTKDDRRFRVYKNKLKKQIQSPYSARNYGLKKIRGSYICFLDIDDFWLPEKLKSDFNFLEKFNSDNFL